MGESLKKLKDRAALELRDALELVLIPGIAAVLPWTWAFRIFKRMAHWKWLYAAQCNAALHQARQRGWAGDNEPHWIWARRLTTLVDHADHYLGLARTDAWLRDNVEIKGQWPATGKRVLMTTFHWGAGYWGLRSAAGAGIHPHALVASLDTSAYKGRSVMLWYAKSRNANVARTLQAQTIDASKNLKSVIKAIRQDHPILGLMDVPADSAAAGVTIQILGMPAGVPKGLLRLTVDQNLTLVLYTTGLDTRSGRRQLRIETLGHYSDIDVLSSDLFKHLEACIAMDSPAWHFWSIADRFFLSPLH